MCSPAAPAAQKACRWSSDGKGSYTVEPVAAEDAPARGTRVVLHLMEDAKSYTEKFNIERIIRANSGHVPVPISVVEKPGAEAAEVADGAALWTKPRSEIKPEEYTDFYRNFGNFDEPALTVHFRAEGRHEFTALAFVPSARPFDLYDAERKGRMKLYVKRVFITDDAEILPRYLRFVRGLVDSNDLPLSLSREMIQQSPILAAIKKSVTGRVLTDLEKLADSDAEAYGKIWDVFGSVIKEGIYEDYERRDQLLKLARFRTTASAEPRRTLKDYVAALKPNQTAIYYIAGEDAAQIENSPHLEGFRARGIEVLLLSDMVDSLWTSAMPSFDGKKLKSVTQGAADLAAIELPDDKKEEAKPEANEAVTNFIAFVKLTLGDAVSDVRASDRLTDSAVCLVASEGGMDRSLEKLLQGSGRVVNATKPILEINPRNALVTALAGARRRRGFLQTRRRASAVRRGARARRREANRRPALLRAPGPADHAGTSEGLAFRLKPAVAAPLRPSDRPATCQFPRCRRHWRSTSGRGNSGNDRQGAGPHGAAHRAGAGGRVHPGGPAQFRQRGRPLSVRLLPAGLRRGPGFRHGRHDVPRRRGGDPAQRASADGRPGPLHAGPGAPGAADRRASFS